MKKFPDPPNNQTNNHFLVRPHLPFRSTSSPPPHLHLAQIVSYLRSPTHDGGGLRRGWRLHIVLSPSHTPWCHRRGGAGPSAELSYPNPNFYLVPAGRAPPVSRNNVCLILYGGAFSCVCVGVQKKRARRGWGSGMVPARLLKWCNWEHDRRRGGWDGISQPRSF